MAKKKSDFTPIELGTLGSEFDNIFNDDKLPKEAAKPVSPPAEAKPASPSEEAEPASQPIAAAPKPARAKAKTRQPRKKKAATKASSESTPEADQNTPPPSTNFDKETLGWFFTNTPDLGAVKQVYVDENTKETLHGVARATGIPIGHLTENIIRWFLLSNKPEISKLIARNRDPFNHIG